MSLISSLNLASETPLEKQEARKIKTVLQFLIDQGDSVQFREPVDYVGLNLADYTSLISKPMDLGTVNNKIKHEQYRFVEQVLDDIQLIWDNCKSYNEATSWIYGIADKMDRYFKKLIKNYFGNVIISQNLSKNVSLEASEPIFTNKVSRTVKKVQKNESKMYYDQEDDLSSNEKSKIMQKMKRLNVENLGVIVQMILQNCPKAYKFVDDDSCQIFIQKIDSQLLREIKEKIAQLRQNEDRLIKKIKI